MDHDDECLSSLLDYRSEYYTLIDGNVPVGSIGGPNERTTRDVLIEVTQSFAFKRMYSTVQRASCQVDGVLESLTGSSERVIFNIPEDKKISL